VLCPRHPDLVPSLLSELLPEMVSRSAELRMLPPHPPTQPDARTAAADADSEYIIRDKIVKGHASIALTCVML